MRFGATDRKTHPTTSVNHPLAAAYGLTSEESGWQVASSSWASSVASAGPQDTEDDHPLLGDEDEVDGQALAVRPERAVRIGASGFALAKLSATHGWIARPSTTEVSAGSTSAFSRAPLRCSRSATGVRGVRHHLRGNRMR